jgi:hypothetical protein
VTDSSLDSVSVPRHSMVVGLNLHCGPFRDADYSLHDMKKVKAEATSAFIGNQFPLILFDAPREEGTSWV